MNTTAQIKQSIKKSAQQLQQEPLELLKAARSQVTGENLKPSQNNSSSEASQSGTDNISKEETEYKRQVAEQDGKHLQALESELRDIRRQKLFNELMRRIQQGEKIPLEEFSELSYEQRDVLKAQMEAYQKQEANSHYNDGGLIEPGSKKGRRMVGGGQKQSAQKQTTRVEKPVPPSG